MATDLKMLPSLFQKYNTAAGILDKICLWKGDITKLRVDAIVNAANSGLRGGGGVDGAIHSAAGHRALQEECRKIGFCDVGNAVITSACDIKHVKNILHTVGPQLYSSAPSIQDREKLVSCYEQSLSLAVQNNLKTIAFCCISTGVYGYPNKDAAIAVGEFLTEWLESSDHKNKVDKIVLCVFLPVDERCYEKFFEKYAMERT